MDKKDRTKLLKKYRTQVSGAVRWRSDNYDQKWKKFIHMYGLETFTKDDFETYNDWVAVNIAFSIINTISPAVSVNYPKITVNPATPEDQDAARTAEAVVNYWWRHFDFREEFRRVVKDFLVVGHGWVKTTYIFAEETQEMDDEEYKAQMSAALEEKYRALELDPSIELPSDEEIVQGLPTHKKVVLQDRPNVERVSPFDIFVDPDATSLSDARWIAQRITMETEAAQKREDWDSKIRANLKGTAESGARMDETKGYYKENEDKECTYVVIWEYYDLVNGRVCWFEQSGDDFLRDPTRTPYSFGHPFVMIRNYDVPETFYPIGDIEAIASLQDELNLTRTSQMNDRKQYRRKYLVNEQAFDDEGLSDLESDKDNAIIRVRNGVPLNEAIAVAPVMTTNPEFYQLSDVILEDMRVVSATSEYSQGAMPEIRRTATEANLIQDAANARSADKLTTVEICISNVARRVVQLAQQFLSTEQVARVAGEQAGMSWVAFDRDAIAGEFDFEVEAGSTQPQNESYRRQSALQMMDVMAPFLGPGPDGQPVIDPRAFAKYILENGFGVKNADDFITQPMMPAPAMGDPAMGGMPPEGMPPAAGGMPMDPAMMDPAMMGGAV